MSSVTIITYVLIGLFLLFGALGILVTYRYVRLLKKHKDVMAEVLHALQRTPREPLTRIA